MRCALVGVPQARLLHDALAALEQIGLARDLVLDRRLDVLEGVHVLELGLRAQLGLAAQPHRHVGVAAQRALLHVAVGDRQPAHELTDGAQIGRRLGRRAQLGLAHDLDQRHARAVVVDQRIGRAGHVRVLAGVLFHVNAVEAYFAQLPVEDELDAAALAQGLVHLRDLKSLGRVGIEIVLAREAAERANLALQRPARGAPRTPPPPWTAPAACPAAPACTDPCACWGAAP